MASIGFIGLGIMGGPMALNLQKGGHHLFLHSRSGVRDKALMEGGGTECTTPAEVATATEFIITMLPNTTDVEAVFIRGEWRRVRSYAKRQTSDRYELDRAACN